MPLTPGTRLGHYEVASSLGAGGMSACGQASERPFDGAQGWPEHVEGRSESSLLSAGVGRLRSAEPSFGELRRSFAEARPRAIRTK